MELLARADQVITVSQSRVRASQTFSVRCDAAIESCYRITFCRGSVAGSMRVHVESPRGIARVEPKIVNQPIL
jgi:hypothetical protein